MGKVIIIITVLILTVQSNSQGWVQQTSGTALNLYSASFLDSHLGFVAGTDIILKTTNGGINWINTNAPLYNYSQVIFLNNNTGYASTGSGIVKTTNSGSIWNFYSTPFPNNSISFINTATGYSCGSDQNANRKIMKTVDGGITWNVIYSISSMYVFKSIYFSDSLTGYNTRYYHQESSWIDNIYRTSNGGLNWDIVYSQPNDHLESFFFLSQGYGYLAGFGRVLETSNGGSNWISHAFTNIAFYTVFFTDYNTGYVAGGQSGFTRIYRTTNAGIDWNLSLNFNSGALRSLTFPNVKTGYAVGDNGVILKTTNSGVTPMLPISTEIPDHFSLSQNYPNPFNPSTKIRFEISGSSAAQTFISVYDILGREVATLVNEELKPGTYEVDWNASDFPSGVYFYKLETEYFTETKRMILLK